MRAGTVVYVCMNPPWSHTSGWWWEYQSCRSRWQRYSPGSPQRAGFWRWRSSWPYDVFPMPSMWWWQRAGLWRTKWQNLSECTMKLLWNSKEKAGFKSEETSVQNHLNFMLTAVMVQWWSAPKLLCSQNIFLWDWRVQDIQSSCALTKNCAQILGKYQFPHWYVEGLEIIQCSFIVASVFADDVVLLASSCCDLMMSVGTVYSWLQCDGEVCVWAKSKTV